MSGGEILLRCEDGTARALPVDHWLGEPPGEEWAVLERAAGPVLDVGCGPGRHVLALSQRGVVAMGIDTASSAVRAGRERGASILERSVFDRVPGPGRWATALLLDGNVGIGGDPPGLLRRVRELLEPRGRLLLEVEPPGAPSGTVRARIERDGEVGPWFAWARVGADALPGLARDAGYRPAETWTGGGRWFAELAAC